MATADELIAALKLSPHPEGGGFFETFRDAGSIPPFDFRRFELARPGWAAGLPAP